tara:strand:+ start:15417 stop:15545 length:129 start_codon:yes stop_codon:yes gene_type:complete
MAIFAQNALDQSSSEHVSARTSAGPKPALLKTMVNTITGIAI